MEQFPPTLCGRVGEAAPLLLNKRLNYNQELFLVSLPGYLLHLVPVTRIEFRRIKGGGDGWWKDNSETVLGVFRLFFTQREPEYDQDTDLHQRESTQVRRGGRDGRREPDSGLGYTQDYRSQWTHENCVEPDSASQRTEPRADHKRRAGGPEETGTHRDSWWDIPRKRALFTSDGPDSTTSGSDIPEGHADRPPEVEYSERLTSAKRQDEGRTEGLCSPHMELEMAVIQLQRDVEDCHSELELARKQTSAVTRLPQRRSGFMSTPVPRYSGKSNWEQYREVFEAIVCSNGWDDVTAALQLLSNLDGDALNFTGSGVSKGGARIFDKVVIRTLQRSGAFGRIQASVSAGVSASGK